MLTQNYIFKVFQPLIYVKFRINIFYFNIFFEILGFLFYCFNLYELLEFYAEKLLNFIMKKFDCLAFLYFMIVCFMLYSFHFLKN